MDYAGAPLLTLKGIEVVRGQWPILHDLTFSLWKQEIVSIIGPNGAGKSTIFDVITGFLRPLRGEIRFRGIDITGKSPSSICHLGISRTFQIARPFPTMTAMENVLVAIAFGKARKVPIDRRMRERAHGFLETVGIAHKSDIIARSLTLSEQRRLEVARAMATEPELLLLDEFAAGLSPKAIDRALQLIETLRRQGLTLLITDHFLNVTARASDRIIAIDGGRIIASGRPTDVLKNPAVASAYLGVER